MEEQANNTPEKILRAAKTILLVDWPDTGVPRVLVKAGFTVYGYSPGSYTIAGIVAGKPNDANGLSVFPPKGDELGYLIFKKLESRPDWVDIVSVYRPVEELPGIIEHIVPPGAKVLWLQPPLRSAIGRELAAENHLEFVEGVAIADIATKI